MHRTEILTDYPRCTLLRDSPRLAARRTLLRHLLCLAALSMTDASYALDTAPEPGAQLAGFAHELFKGLDSPELTSFLEGWPAPSALRSSVPSSVPALRWLPRCHDAATQFSCRFVDAVVAAAPVLAWRRTYTPALLWLHRIDAGTFGTSNEATPSWRS